MNTPYKIYNESCYSLQHVKDNSIDAIITDPPYGINLEEWDKMPDKSIWQDCYKKLKPGGFLLCFSSIQFQHVFTTQIIEAGFEFKDVLLWVFLNGRVPPINADKQIDNYLGEEREIIGQYNYVQGSPNSNKKTSYTEKRNKTKASEKSKPWEGFGTGLKTSYEPIIMVQKPFEKNLAHNLLEYGVGALNLEDTRIPYDENDKKVGHNPHPKGRVMANIIQTESFGEYQKFFFVGKVRDGKKTGNSHPTVKPTELMQTLINLVSQENQTILDPFMGSGSTGVGCLIEKRNFIGYEKKLEYFNIAQKRLDTKK